MPKVRILTTEEAAQRTGMTVDAIKKRQAEAAKRALSMPTSGAAGSGGSAASSDAGFVPEDSHSGAGPVGTQKRIWDATR